jgi:hypothetical protein
LCGSGTAGAYQAGVLKALAEAGIKVDVVAGHGPGVANALGAAIDGGSRFWEDHGPWASTALRRAYQWRAGLRVLFAGLVLAAVIMVSPALVLVIAALMYAASALAALLNFAGAAEWLVGLYAGLIALLFDPPILPTIVPRAVVLALLVVVGVLVVSAVRAAADDRSRRRLRGGFWWRLVGVPLDAAEPGATMAAALWHSIRGATSGPAPEVADVGRRYVEVLADNLGQPGFREVLVAVHDIDGRRDVVGAVLGPQSRGRFEAKRRAPGPREAEALDLSGPHRDVAVDFLMGGLRLPVATAPWPMQFPTESYWRGELHHVCDRPELASRLLEEVGALGVEQVILVSAAPPAASAHSLRPRPADMRSRVGAHVRSVETAAFDAACAAAEARFAGVFVIRPAHNPIGPFDFAGLYDESSDRSVTLADLARHGFDDAYDAFIEPVVAAGETLDPPEGYGQASID